MMANTTHYPTIKYLFNHYYIKLTVLLYSKYLGLQSKIINVLNWVVALGQMHELHDPIS